MNKQQETATSRVAAGRRRSWFLGALGIAALALAAWYLFAPTPVSVEMAAVESGPLQVTVNNQGQVRVHDKYVIAAPVAAEIARIALHDGDPVARGAEVAVLSPLPMDERQRREALARLDAAKALEREASLRAGRAKTDMEFAISERARVERLVRDNFVSPQAVEKAATAERTSRAEWNAAISRQQAAAADVKAAEAALLADARDARGGKRELLLSSPVDGYILKVHEKSEHTVNAGAPLVTIGDPTRYEIVVDVLSTDAVKVKQGDTMLLEGWGGGKTLRARVRLVEPVAFTKISSLGVEEQRVNIVADPVDPLGPLGDGYRVEARIVVWQADKVTKLPASSLFRVGEEWHVFTVESGRAHERRVQVGQRNQDEAQVLSGISAGAKVVRYPGNELRDGVRVTSREAA
ncbi:MAG TPA: HlyD family efflux transporter periplasmic adaptor subunit [Noviherbaspirillum sp.]|uniref:efflux RND transporter periplasmic adaptor subunit n=1 Tax=Noviherbaspirillum sp. TaxID=1926288 RepID=UPI002B47A7F3|nr:HlyD family efflux transporter periplasmic adaptor subunit [Noviherbaspirillum sp.]HJV85125.1 HlyD family efflux transporter periplasmic adaptor subunit [Noviherbaspirillum sp.]